METLEIVSIRVIELIIKENLEGSRLLSQTETEELVTPISPENISRQKHCSKSSLKNVTYSKKKKKKKNIDNQVKEV